MKYISLFSIISIFLFSCAKDNSSGTRDEGTTDEASVNCTYSVQPAYTTVNWTAYKTSARVGVGGTFTDLGIKASAEEGSLQEIMTGLEFTLNVASTSTKDTSRDRKIRDYFFGTMAGMLGTEAITGTINSVEGNDSAGTANITVAMNQMENQVDAPYRVEGSTVIIETSLKMADWNATSSIDSLNSVCYDLHKGEDGVSKLWPDVDVVIESVLKKNCDTDDVAVSH